MSADGDRVALAALVGNGLLAGGNAVAIRYSNRELAPLWGASLRFALAAALLLAAMAVLRLRFPRGRAMAGAVLFGAFNFGGGFALIYVALVELHAGFGQILLALVPLATLLVAVLERQERFRVAAVVGAVVALAGIAVMSRTSLRALPLLPVVAAVGSALCFAQAAVLVRRFPPVHPVTMNAVAMATDATWAAVAYVVVVGSVVVFLLYLVVLHRWAASRAAYLFVLIPFVTVALSAWLDDEPVEATLVLGGLLVLAGVYVGALRPQRLSSPAPGAPARGATR